MLPHPDTVAHVTTLQRQELLATVARERRAEDAVPVGDRPARLAAARWRVGGALLRFGTRLQEVGVGADAAPIGSPATGSIVSR